MPYENGLIKSPISLPELYRAFGIGASSGCSLTHLCSNQHGRINPWSRYRPVCLGQPLNPDSIDGNVPDKFWREGPVIDSSRPWFWGTRSHPAFTIPVVSQLSDYLDADGNVLESAKWKPNFPGPGIDYCRLSDFLGYTHDAKPPLYAVVHWKDKVRPDGKIILSVHRNSESYNDQIAKREGYWSPKSVLGMLMDTGNDSTGVALGVCIHNRTQGVVVTGTVGRDLTYLISQSTDLVFRTELDMSYSGSPSGSVPGVGHRPRVGDVLDVFLYLYKKTKNSNDSNRLSGNTYSFYVSDEHPALRRLNVVTEDREIIRRTLGYIWNINQDCSSEGYWFIDEPVYYTDNGYDIYKVDTFFLNFYMPTIYVSFDSSYPDNSYVEHKQHEIRTYVVFPMTIYEEGEKPRSENLTFSYARQSTIPASFTPPSGSYQGRFYRTFEDASLREDPIDPVSLIENAPFLVKDIVPVPYSKVRLDNDYNEIESWVSTDTPHLSLSVGPTERREETDTIIYDYSSGSIRYTGSASLDF